VNQKSRKRCSWCRTKLDHDCEDTRYGPVYVYCSYQCQGDHAIAIRDKQIAKRKEREDKGLPPKRVQKKRTKIELMQDRKFWADKVEKECHSYIVERDAKLPCISCQSSQGYQFDAGHFKTRAGFPELRYNTFNISKQCRRCNSRSGNINGGKGFGRGYVWGLMDRHGIERIHYLERNHPAKHYSTYELERLFKWFRYRRNQIKQRVLNDE